MSDLGTSDIETLEIKKRTSREIQIIKNFHMEVRLKHITYGDARNLTTEDLEKFK